jgi:hypothetical protein
MRRRLPPRMNAATLAKLGLISAGMQVKVSTTETRAGTSLGGTAILAAQLDDGVPDGCVRVAAGHESDRRPGPDAGRNHRGACVMENPVSAVLPVVLEPVRPVGCRCGRWSKPVWPLVWVLMKIVAIIVPLMLTVAYLTFWPSAR